jgi:hypothetical protein
MHHYYSKAGVWFLQQNRINEILKPAFHVLIYPLSTQNRQVLTIILNLVAVLRFEYS